MDDLIKYMLNSNIHIQALEVETVDHDAYKYKKSWVCELVFVFSTHINQYYLALCQFTTNLSLRENFYWQTFRFLIFSNIYQNTQTYFISYCCLHQQYWGQ